MPRPKPRAAAATDLLRTPGARVLSVNLAALAPPADPGPGPWVVEMPGWTPPTVNALMRGHWAARARLKKQAVAAVAKALRDAGVPPAKGKRTVAVTVTRPNRSHLPDPDNALKAILDGCVAAGVLVDDSAGWCEAKAEVAVGPKGTRVVVGDVKGEEHADT